jgi:hypothetical protein
VGNPLTPFLPSATNFLIVVSAMAVLLGPLNLVRRYLGMIVRREQGRLEGAVFLVFLAVSIVAASCEGANIHRAFDTLYNALFYGVQTAFFASSMALLAFYLVSAAHRAFRINNLEAGLMMASAVVILLSPGAAGRLADAGPAGRVSGAPCGPVDPGRAQHGRAAGR